jgi:Protein of unknown function (DUF3168)
VSVLEAIRVALVNHPPVADLVGDRIYPDALPAKALVPAIVLSEVAVRFTHTQDGPAGLVRSRVQVDAWATTWAEADTVAAAARVLLDGLRNVDDGGTIQGSFADARRKLYDQDRKLTGRSVDYLIWNEE